MPRTQQEHIWITKRIPPSPPNRPVWQEQKVVVIRIALDLFNKKVLLKKDNKCYGLTKNYYYDNVGIHPWLEKIILEIHLEE